MGKLDKMGCLLAAAIFCGPLAAAEMAPYPETGVQLGTGWQSTRMEKTHENCIVAKQVSDDAERRTQDFREFTDAASLMSSLSMSAKAKASWILGSASGGGSLARNYTMNMNALNIRVDVRINKGISYLAPGDGGPGQASAIQLRGDLVALAANQPVEFRRRCGDAFVSSIQRQVGIQGVYAFQTRTQTERDKIRGHVSGSYGLFSGSASAKQILESMGREGRLTIQYTQLGGTGLQVATNEEQFRALVRDLGTVSAGSVPLEMGITYYSELPNYPQSESAVDPDIGLIADQYFRLETLHSAISEMRQDRYGYALYDDAEFRRLERLQDAVISDMGALKKELASCIRNNRDCVYPAGLSRDDYDVRAQLPIRLSEVPGLENFLTQQDQLLQRIGVLWQPPVTPSEQQELRMLEEQQEELRRQREKAVLDARFRTWIENPSIARCQQDTAACLDVQRRDALRQRYFNTTFGSYGVL